MISPREINRLVENYIGTHEGYLNHFTYSKHDKFYHVYCDLDVDVQAYRNKCGTTRKAFVQILKDSQPRDQARIIRGVFEMIPPPDEDTDAESREKIILHKELLAVACRLEANGQVDSPGIQDTSETVYEALKDAEMLLRTRGPVSAVDRAHTALHGYLKKLCLARGKEIPSDASLTATFKVLRDQSTDFLVATVHDGETKKVIGAIATILDSMNTIRNRGTLVHPNEVLLDAPEAMLYVNLSRTFLTYIESKTGKFGRSKYKECRKENPQP